MKLATYQDGSRDGQLVVVSRDLGQACYATGIATRLQQVLDDWNFLSPQLQDLYVTLNHGRARHAFAFEPRRCMAPLPRAYQRVEGLAYASHAERLLRARGAELPAAGEPPLLQLGSDALLGPCDEAWFGSESWGIDFGAQLAVVSGDVEMGASPAQALEGVRLLLLANGWRLRALAPADPFGGAAALPSQPAAAFGPVAVTPDELGEAWRGGRVLLTLQSSWNGRKFGLCETGPEMGAHFGQLIAQLSKTRPLRAGTIVGSGVVSNQDAGRGFGCIAEKQALEQIEHGAPRTGFMKFGDTVRLEVQGADGLGLFGAIEQRVVGPGMARDEPEADEERPGATPMPATDAANADDSADPAP